MAFRDEVLADAPLAYYEFDETSGTAAADSSGNAHGGTYRNTPTLDQPSALGKSVSFASASNEDVLLDTLGALGASLLTSTVEFVIRTTSTAGPQAIYGTASTGSSMIMAAYLNADNAEALSVGKTCFHYRDTGNRDLRGHISTNIYDGQEHHVVVVMTAGNSFDVMVDGVHVAVTMNTAANETLSTFANFGFPMTVAMFNNRAVYIRPADLTLSELAFYPTRLSPARVVAHYEAIVPTPVAVPDVIGVTTSGRLGAGDVIVNVPAGLAVGDLLLTAIEIDTGSTALMPTVPNWRRFMELHESGSDQQVIGLWRIAEAGFGSSHTFTVPTSATIHMIAIRGADQNAPLHVVNGVSTANATSHANAGVTTEVANCLLVGFWAANPATAATVWTPDGMVKQAESAFSTSLLRLLTATQPRPAIGATGTRTAVLSAADVAVSALIAIVPAGTAKTTQRPVVLGSDTGGNDGQMAFEVLTSEVINEGDHIVGIYIGTRGGEPPLTSANCCVIDFYGSANFGEPERMSGLGVEIPSVTVGGFVANGLTVCHRRAKGTYPAGSRFGIGNQNGTVLPQVSGAIIKFPAGMLSEADPFDAESHSQDAVASLAISLGLPTPRSQRESILLYIDGLIINASATSPRTIPVAGSDDGGSGFEKLTGVWTAPSNARGVGHAIGWGLSTRQAGGTWRAPNNFGVFNAPTVIALNAYVPEVREPVFIASAEEIYMPDVGDSAQKPSAYPLKMIL